MGWLVDKSGTGGVTDDASTGPTCGERGTSLRERGSIKGAGSGRGLMTRSHWE